MKVKELKAALKDLGLSTKGKKSDLEARLTEAELPEEEEIEEQVIEEVVEEELEEEIAEEEEAPVEEEVVEEEEEVVEEEKVSVDHNGILPDCDCEWCANGYAHRESNIEKIPDVPSTRWVKEVYGKKPNGGYVYKGIHYDGEGNLMPESDNPLN